MSAGSVTTLGWRILAGNCRQLCRRLGLRLRSRFRPLLIKPDMWFFRTEPSDKALFFYGNLLIRAFPPDPYIR